MKDNTTQEWDTQSNLIDKEISKIDEQKHNYQEANQQTPFIEKTLKTDKIKKILSDNIIALVLLGFGIFYLIQSIIDNIKISFTLILIATFLIFLMTGEQDPQLDSQKKYSTKNPFRKTKFQKVIFRKKSQVMPKKTRSIPFSNKISITLILWTILLFVLTQDIEIYIILIFIGIIIARELTDMHISDIYKKRLDAYIIIFLLTYIIITSQKIIEIAKV